jgi:hypothetical protein
MGDPKVLAQCMTALFPIPEDGDPTDREAALRVVATAITKLCNL